MNKITPERRAQGLKIVEDLCRHMRGITADLIFEALTVNKFSEDERTRLTGALIRSASAKGWIKASEKFIRSTKNHSNLQILWDCLLLDDGLKSGKITVNGLAAKYDEWTEAGLNVPMALAFDFESRESNKT